MHGVSAFDVRSAWGTRYVHPIGPFLFLTPFARMRALATTSRPSSPGAITSAALRCARPPCCTRRSAGAPHRASQRCVAHMLRRVTAHEDPGLPREVLLQPLLEALPRTGQGLPNLRIGRHPNNDIVLTSAGVPLLLSRQHALVTYDGEQLAVVDLNTTNGTYVRARPRVSRALGAVLAPCQGRWVGTRALRRPGRRIGPREPCHAENRAARASRGGVRLAARRNGPV